jgi:hypothetical protein
VLKASLQNGGKVMSALRNKLKAEVAEFGFQASVGYSAPYALYVHENTQAAHPNGGQAKYLEQPARRLQRQAVAVVLKAKRQGQPMRKAVRLGLQLILDASQQLVPVDTGKLKRSGFVRVEK